MSYLNSLRLHFSGKFQAAPSTVNNDPTHYDNSTFQPSFQLPSSGNQPNGWWNPTGDAVWRLIGCKVTSAWMDGAAVPANDPIHSYLVADSDRTVSAKLVDLDPEQQLVSEIWGMQVRICHADGTNLLRALYKTAPFNDIWNRAPGGGDLIAGAAYQSVLYDLEWGDIGSSDFLEHLRTASAATGKLSIKFNVDGYNMVPTSADFTRGRFAGTIGPSLPGEPDHLVTGRHFMTTDLGGGFFVPAGKINFCPAVVDEGAGKILIDLGNSLPSTISGGPVVDLGTLTLGYTDSGFQAIGPIDYLAAGVFDRDAGVFEIPSGRKLTASELTAIASKPLALTITQGGIDESADGLYARADQFVFRANPGETVEARVFATQYGAPLVGATVLNALDPSQLQGQEAGGINVATPEDALSFPASMATGPDGTEVLQIQVSNPGNPRNFIDGQVYGVRPALQEAQNNNDIVNPWDYISILAHSAFAAENPPTWFGSLQPIFQQYANLYPVMKRFLDMADYDSVCAHVKLLNLAFSLPMEDPNSMPITRDLSAAKRAAILHWLSHPGPDGLPLKGTPPPPVVIQVAAPMPAAAPAPPQPPPSKDGPMRGGKAIAMSRRLIVIRGKQ